MPPTEKSADPTRLALAATVVALSRPPRLPMDRSVQPIQVVAATVPVPSRATQPLLNEVSIAAPVPVSKVEQYRDPGEEGDTAAAVTAPGSDEYEDSESRTVGDVQEPETASQPDSTAQSSAATVLDDDIEPAAGHGSPVLSDQQEPADELSLAAIMAPQLKPSRGLSTGEAATGYVVQLSSVATEDGAISELSKIKRRFPELLEGHGLAVQKAELNDRGSRFRVRTAPFANRADAAAFCSKLKILDQDCLVVRL